MKITSGYKNIDLFEFLEQYEINLTDCASTSLIIERFSQGENIIYSGIALLPTPLLPTPLLQYCPLATGCHALNIDLLVILFLY